MKAQARSQKNQRMANVVAVTDVSELESSERTDFFFDGQKIGQSLAGMEFVGKRVDHRDFGVGGQFFQDALFINTRDDTMHPALQVASHVGDTLALAQTRLSVIQKNHRAAHALDAYFKSHAGAQRGLFEDQRDEFAAQRGGIASRMRLDVRREMQQLA